MPPKTRNNRRGLYQQKYCKFKSISHQGSPGMAPRRRFSGPRRPLQQDSLISVLKYRRMISKIIEELPRRRFLTPSFLGLKFSDDFLLLELASIAGRPKETNSPCASS